MSGWTAIVLLLLPLAVLHAVSSQRLSQTPRGCRVSGQGGEVVIRAIGEVWTGPGCRRGECRLERDNSPDVLWSTCEPSPFPDCEPVEQSAPAEFPDCCPKYRCPGRCFSSSLKRWFALGDKWTEPGCHRATCFEEGNVGLLPCGLIAAPEPGCRAVPGDPDAEYPACCHKVECDQGPGEERPCYDKQLDRHFAVGERWTLSGCSGQATCGAGGAVAAVGCPLEATDSPTCSLDGGDPSLEYPQCCPKIICPACHSSRLDRYFGPGDSWTDSSCILNKCQAGPFGADVQKQTCSPLGEPPYPDCQEVGTDLERGDFPRCCPFLRCPGRCQENGRWYSVGDQWDDGCTRAVCIGTGRVERLACPMVRFDTSRRDCRVVQGNDSAAFPACCDNVQCDPPRDQCQDSEGRGRPIGDVWTDGQCLRAECRAVEGGATIARRSPCPPPPSADCRMVSGEKPGREFPLCCPTYRCPGRCHSPLQDIWFSVGDEWTEDGCIQATCVSSGQVRQAPCPFVRARRRGCRVVPGDLAAEYPGCCFQVKCEPNPYG